MFRSAQQFRTFLVVVLTYMLDLVGYSIVFPVLAPLLLNPELHFFSADTLIATRTTVLGLLFGVFGVSQFIGAPVAGALADHYGRYRIFLWTISVSVFGYALMAFSIYEQNLGYLFIGRIVTGFCSGNFAIAQSAVADLTDVQHRSRAFGVLQGIGGLGFVAGPWVGGILANPHWLSGCGAFIFASIAALINLLVICFFYVETHPRTAKQINIKLWNTFKDLRLVLEKKTLRTILSAYLLFSIGWGFFLVFSPTYLVQKFSLGSEVIGNIFAYMALVWFFISMFLNKELSGKFSLRTLILAGTLISAVGVGIYLLPNTLWPYWFVIPFAISGGALAWVNLNALLSVKASEDMQGRALGAGGSMWSLGEIIAPCVAGPLAGWNMHFPLLLGAIILLLSFLYFISNYRRRHDKTSV